MKHLTLKLNINQYVCLIVCFLLMIIVPIVRSNKLFGHKIFNNSEVPTVETLVKKNDGTMVINTSEIGKDIIGYRGPTPVEIEIADNRIKKIKALPNEETPEFFGAVRNSDLLESFNGMTLREAVDAKIDGVAGATFTSDAVIGNIKVGVNYALQQENVAGANELTAPGTIDLKWFATILIILCGAILPLFIKNIKYRFVQLGLNVLVLGFWGGTFVSYSLMVYSLTNGITRIFLIPGALMMLVAFVYPLFGKPDHYCTWLCPYGALQELAGKCCRYKIKLSAGTIKFLTAFRQILWFALMWLLWTGLWLDWMDYEPFAAFFFTDASWVVLTIAVMFILLSLIVNRPYCRFVCPTGSLFKFSEGRN